MLLHTFYEGIEIHRREKIVLVKLLQPHNVITTCRADGGFREDVSVVYNHQSCEPTGHHHLMKDTAARDPKNYRRIVCERHGLPDAHCATMGTAANMNNLAVAAERFRDLQTVAVCTGGVETNAGRIGDPASVWEGEDGHEKLRPQEAGTIVTMLFVNKALTPGALVRAIVTATEAKSAVLQELAVNSRYSDRLATGTGTDQITVACMRDTGKPLAGSGKHSKLGELIGSCVYQAIKNTLAWQNELTPAGQCSARIHIERFGATRELMLGGIGRHLTPENHQLLADNYDCINRDPLTVAAVAALVHLKDKLVWGVLPTECAAEIMSIHAAELAASVSGKWDRLNIYRTRLEPGPDPAHSGRFLEGVYRAMAAGFAEKWTWSFEDR